MDSQQSPNNNIEPSLCANGCGFYGSEQNMKLCSKCYKDFLKELNDMSLTQIETAKFTDEKPQNLTTQYDNISDSVIKNRCKRCNKKVRLMGFKCRCGSLFCGTHRYPEAHGCTVDLKMVGRVVLVSQNPICKGDKMQERMS